jgi:PAS domain S-box-containing protein
MSYSSDGGRADWYQTLRESVELHRATLSSISDAVFLLNDEGAFRYISPNVNVIFGYDPDELHAMGDVRRLLGEDLFDESELIAQGELPNIEREVVSKQGEQRIVLVHMKRVSIMNGTVLCTCRDITALKQAERALAATRLELAHAARLALVGELTACIVHQIRQSLTAILANASAAVRMTQGLGGDSTLTELTEICSDMQRHSANAADIIERLTNLARKQPPELKCHDMNEIAHDVLRLAAVDAYRREVTIRAELAAFPLRINADRISLQQVILNLVVNAMDAMEHNARERKQLFLRSREASGTVEISVSDSGGGIAHDSFPRLFDAFFTTKPEGLGLGLSIARLIVEAHGGRIWAENHDMGGATFRLVLPLHAETSA